MLVALVAIALGMGAIFAYKASLRGSGGGWGYDPAKLAQYDSKLGPRVSLGPFTFRPPADMQQVRNYTRTEFRPLVHMRYVQGEADPRGQRAPDVLLDVMVLDGTEENQNELVGNVARIVQEFELEAAQHVEHLHSEDLETEDMIFERVVIRGVRGSQQVSLAIYIGWSYGDEMAMFVALAPGSFESERFAILEVAILSMEYIDPDLETDPALEPPTEGEAAADDSAALPVE